MNTANNESWSYGIVEQEIYYFLVKVRYKQQEPNSYIILNDKRKNTSRPLIDWIYNYGFDGIQERAYECFDISTLIETFVCKEELKYRYPEELL